MPVLWEGIETGQNLVAEVLGKLRGVEIALDWSVLLIFVLNHAVWDVASRGR